MVHRLSIEYRALDSLQLNPRNSRRHKKRQIQQIANSIRAFGYLVPLLVDAKGTILAGHGRALAARLIGMTEVPTITIDHLSDAQISAFMIADNRLTENSDWNKELLAEQFKILSALELDFSVDVTGFEMGEIELLIEGPASPGSRRNDLADVIPDSWAEPLVSQPGDLWLLDRHKVYCGDAREDASYPIVTEGRRAAVVFTDPPYNDPIDGYVTNFGKLHHPEFAMASGEMSASEFTNFLISVFTLQARYSGDGTLQFICMDWRHVAELLAAAQRVFTELKNVCVWVKDRPGQGSLYRSQHEFVFVFKSGNKPHRENIQLGQRGRYRTDVWQYRRVNTSSPRIDDGPLGALHLTSKPVELVADAILDCSARGDIVLDPFLGSGTTLIAAERTGRACCGIELKPHYVDTIVRRWQVFTGQNAIHASTGRSFKELEEEKNGCAE